MLETIKIILLSIVNGLTGALPVSSLAHFSLLKEVFGFTDENFNAPFYYALFSLGTALALYLRYFNMHRNIIKNVFKSDDKLTSNKQHAYKNAGKNIIFSIIPLIVLLIPISKKKVFGSLNTYFLSEGSLIFVGIASIFCAILMFISFWYLNLNKKKVNLLSSKDAVAFGIYQLPAYIFPGFSHIGIGVSRTAVSDIDIKNILNETYLYVAPAYLAVNLFRTIYYSVTAAQIDVLAAVIGLIISFALSVLILNIVKRFTQKTYTIFTVYTLVFGVSVTITSLIQMFA